MSMMNHPPDGFSPETIFAPPFPISPPAIPAKAGIRTIEAKSDIRKQARTAVNAAFLAAGGVDTEPPYL